MSGILQKWFFSHDDKKDHNKALDGLRGIAVIMVLLSHSSNHGIQSWPEMHADIRCTMWDYVVSSTL
jgi:peptidoglycan/LPS O-acetylase OafA/YrhL